MVFEKIESLKEKGNAAFADEKYEESTKLYLEAITLYKSQVHSEIADMYANCVEASLKQEKYELAITDADQALEFDPTSIKCLFHRATANLKLDKIKEAAVDLRKVLSLDPPHSEANSLLREIVPPTKIEKPLRSVFVGHYLRRPLLNPCGTDVESKKYFWKNMKLPLLRMTFLSAQNSRSAHRFFAGITVSELQSTSDVCLRLSPWFAANHLMCEYNLNSVVNAILSKKAAVLMLQLINPANSTLAFSTIKFVGEFGQHKFSNVICQDESKILTDEQSSSGAEIIKGVASSLTRLPYFPASAGIDKLDRALERVAFTVGAQRYRLGKRNRSLLRLVERAATQRSGIETLSLRRGRAQERLQARTWAQRRQLDALRRACGRALTVQLEGNPFLRDLFGLAFMGSAQSTSRDASPVVANSNELALSSGTSVSRKSRRPGMRSEQLRRQARQEARRLKQQRQLQLQNDQDSIL